MKNYPNHKEEPLKASEPPATYSAQPTVFNPSQQLLLQMFAYDSSEEGLLELQQVLTTHYRELADKALDELWDSGRLNQERLQELRNMHLRDILAN